MRVWVFVCVWKTERQENRTVRSKEAKEINYSESRCYGRLLPRPPLNTLRSQHSCRVHVAQVMSPEKIKEKTLYNFLRNLKTNCPRVGVHQPNLLVSDSSEGGASPPPPFGTPVRVEERQLPSPPAYTHPHKSSLW